MFLCSCISGCSELRDEAQRGQPSSEATVHKGSLGRHFLHTLSLHLILHFVPFLLVSTSSHSSRARSRQSFLRTLCSVQLGFKYPTHFPSISQNPYALLSSCEAKSNFKMHSLASPSILLTLSVALSVASGAVLRHPRGLVCYEDNALRSLERFSADAAAFCPAYLKDPSKPVPSNLGTWPASRLSSACNCFEKTAAPAGPATTPTGPRTTLSSTTKKSSVSSPTYPPTPPVKPPTSTSSRPNVVATGAPTSGSKRGLVYDYKSKDYVKFFSNTQKISFGSDWGDSRSPAPGVTLPPNLAFIPTLRVDSKLENNAWNDKVKDLIKSGVKTIFS